MGNWRFSNELNYSTVGRFSERLIFAAHIPVFAYSKIGMQVSMPPSRSWLAPWASQINLRASGDIVNVRNDLKGGLNSLAVENKKTEHMLQKNISENLIPVTVYEGCLEIEPEMVIFFIEIKTTFVFNYYCSN